VSLVFGGLENERGEVQAVVQAGRFRPYVNFTGGSRGSRFFIEKFTMVHYRAKLQGNGMVSIPREKQKELGVKPGDFIEVTLDILKASQPKKTTHLHKKNRW